MSVTFMPGDIFLTRGDSFVSKGIRFFTRGRGESRTEVNHVGLVTGEGTAESALTVEAMTTVKQRTLGAYRDSDSTQVAVYRPINLSEFELKRVVRKAESYVGKSYGYGKIFAHWVDWCLGGVYFARRIFRMDDYPICSWVVAQAFAEVGKDFGVAAGGADPDHIWDFVTANPDKYEVVYPLGRLTL